jgi:hypothetical protein
MGVKYSFPTNLHLSKELLDLISKIFVGNPAQRIALAGVKQHPWYLKNLPDELKVWPELRRGWIGGWGGFCRLLEHLAEAALACNKPITAMASGILAEDLTSCAQS